MQYWWFTWSTKGTAPSVLQFFGANLHPTVLTLFSYNNPEHNVGKKLWREKVECSLEKLYHSLWYMTWNWLFELFSYEQGLCSDFFPFITSQHYQQFPALSTQCQAREITQTLKGQRSITWLVISQIFRIGSETFTSRQKGKSVWKK